MFPKLPKIERDPEKILTTCSCYPICKRRRRPWNGGIQFTSNELLLERKPVDECVKRMPTKVFHNSPCPLFGKTPYVRAIERSKDVKQEVVRVCLAPIDENVDVTYLCLYQMAKKIGVLKLMRQPRPRCSCCGCCPCTINDYQLHDPEREYNRRKDMRAFDKRVKEDCKIMRIMYH